MQKETKKEIVGFRCTSDFKRRIAERAYLQQKDPSEYIHAVIEEDMSQRAIEPTESMKSYFEQKLDQYTDKILSFVAQNIDKRLLTIESKLGISQAVPGKDRFGEVLEYAASKKLEIPEPYRTQIKSALLENKMTIAQAKDVIDKVVAQKAQSKPNA